MQIHLTNSTLETWFVLYTHSRLHNLLQTLLKDNYSKISWAVDWFLYMWWPHMLIISGGSVSNMNFKKEILTPIYCYMKEYESGIFRILFSQSFALFKLRW